MSGKPWLDEFKALSPECQLPTLPTMPTSAPAAYVGNFDNVDIWHSGKGPPPEYDPFSDLPPNEPACRGEWQRWFSLLLSHKLAIGNQPTQRPSGAIEVSHRTHEEAHALALGEAVNLWHSAYGQRPDPASCGGCGKPIGTSTLFALPDGARVHDHADLRCLTAYGDRWRTAATEALQMLGIDAEALAERTQSVD